MKKLMTLIVITLFTVVTFAQESKMEPKPEMKTDAKMKHECYMMKDGVLMHCMGDKMVVQKAPITLKNGTVISPKGEIKMKDGKATKLGNGQCISMMGGIGDYERMHSMQKAEQEIKQETEKKPVPAKD